MKSRSVKFGYIVLCCCLGMSLLAGCEPETVDYAVDGETESVQAEGGIAKKGLEQFVNAPEWQESFTAVNTKGNEVVVQIDAKITVPDAKQMYVVEVEEPVFDEGYKKQVVERIFGEGNYAWESDEFLGEREGISYTLRFEENNPCLGARYDEIRCRSKDITLMAQDISEVMPEGMGGLYYYGVNNSDKLLENQCELSEQEALGVARSFVGELDLGYSVYSYSRPLSWIMDTSRQEIANGYIFHFDVGVEELPFVRYGRQDAYINFDKKKETEDAQYYMWSQMEVFVTGKGVIEMRAHNPLIVTSISGGVNLLALENIEGILKNAITEQFGSFRFKYGSGGDGYLPSVILNHMELIYFRIRDKKHEGFYSYVPAWRLSEGDYSGARAISDWQEWRNAVFINAIDGSVIDFYDEV